jgi:hypothetical protein
MGDNENNRVPDRRDKRRKTYLSSDEGVNEREGDEEEEEEEEDGEVDEEVEEEEKMEEEEEEAEVEVEDISNFWSNLKRGNGRTGNDSLNEVKDCSATY